MDASKKYTDLTGAEKAAALLMAFPDETSARVLRTLSAAQVEKVTAKMLKHENLGSDLQHQVFDEARDMVQAQQYISSGGVDYARGLLAQAIGSDRAEELVSRLVATMESLPFHYLQDVDPAQIATFLHSEHPQIIALILSYLRASQTAIILSSLPEKLQPQVSMRLANMEAINPAIVSQIEDTLKKKLSSVINSDRSKTGGVDFLVSVLSQVDRGTERAILDQLDESAPDLAAEIKKRMFVFENLVTLDDRSIQRVLRDVDGKDLGLAMRGAGAEVRNHIFKNMSQRAADSMREELETGTPVRLKNVEEAQQRIVAVVRRLEDEEEIVISRSGSEVML